MWWGRRMMLATSQAGANKHSKRGYMILLRARRTMLDTS